MIEQLATGLFVPYPANGEMFENDLRLILAAVSEALVARRELVRNIVTVTSAVSPPNHDLPGEAKHA